MIVPLRVCHLLSERTGEMEENKKAEYQKLLKDSLKKVLRILSPKVEKISVFGSYPKSKAGLFSDLDILNYNGN